MCLCVRSGRKREEEEQKVQRRGRYLLERTSIVAAIVWNLYCKAIVRTAEWGINCHCRVGMNRKVASTRVLLNCAFSIQTDPNNTFQSKAPQ